MISTNKIVLDANNDQKAQQVLQRLLVAIREGRLSGEVGVKIIARDGGIVDVRSFTECRE